MLILNLMFVIMCIWQRDSTLADQGIHREKRSWTFHEFPGAIAVGGEQDEHSGRMEDSSQNQEFTNANQVVPGHEGSGTPETQTAIHAQTRRWAVAASSAHHDAQVEVPRAKPKPEVRPRQWVLVGNSRAHGFPKMRNDVTNKEESFIARGHEAYHGFANYQVSLQMFWRNKWYHICGGSLVQENKVVTAGHCVADWGSDPENGKIEFRVGLGWHNLKETDEEYRQTVDVVRVNQHPAYDDSSVGWVEMNDIAMLTLSKNATLNTKVDVIQMENDDPRTDWSGQDCDLTGWGKTEKGMPVVLQRTMLAVLQDVHCEGMWTVLNVVAHTDTELCAIDFYDRSAACSGDSGGPLVCDGRLVGIVSWGLSSCNGCFPSVFTRVAAFKPWVTQQLEG